MQGPTKWRSWLRACSKDPSSPAYKGTQGLGAITGQDARVLEAISACWFLYAASDDNGRAAALIAVNSLLSAMQPQCRGFAKELIAFAMDWHDRDRLWERVI
jgi:hypothetical protein